jgi:ubiquitin-protein ligase
MSVLQVFYDQICSNILKDTWYEVFGVKNTIFEGSGLSQLATASYYSPQRAEATEHMICSPPTRHGE